MFDLSDLKPKSDTITVDLLHPGTGDPLASEKSKMQIILYAPHTKEYKQVVHEQQNKRLERLRSKKKNFVSAEDIENLALEMVVKVTKEWDILLNGEVPKLTVDKVKEIYTEYPFIVEQINEAIDDYNSFTKP
jgi:hypothetical protein